MPRRMVVKLSCCSSSSVLGALLRRMQRSISLSREKGSGVPCDVKEGQFAVYAGSGAELRRFIVDLECLTRPEFLRLLQQAEEEFGFAQEGPLLVPCRPGDFVKILRGRERVEEEAPVDAVDHR